LLDVLSSQDVLSQAVHKPWPSKPAGLPTNGPSPGGKLFSGKTSSGLANAGTAVTINNAAITAANIIMRLIDAPSCLSATPDELLLM